MPSASRQTASMSSHVVFCGAVLMAKRMAPILPKPPRVNQAPSLGRGGEIAHESEVTTAPAGPARRTVWTPEGIDFRGEFWFPVPVPEFWRLIEEFDRYPQWWPWLHELRTDTAGLVDGNVLRGTIVPPIPYRVRLQVRLHSCVPMVVTKATLGGDLAGHATLQFEPARGG